MISLDLMKSSEVRKADDQSNNTTKLFRNKKRIKTNIKPKIMEKLHTILSIVYYTKYHTLPQSVS